MKIYKKKLENCPIHGATTCVSTRKKRKYNENFSVHARKKWFIHKGCF